MKSILRFASLKKSEIKKPLLIMENEDKKVLDSCYFDTLYLEVKAYSRVSFSPFEDKFIWKERIADCKRVLLDHVYGEVIDAVNKAITYIQRGESYAALEVLQKMSGKLTDTDVKVDGQSE